MAVITAVELPGIDSSFSIRELTHAFQVDRSSTAPLASDLERHNILHGYAAYWLAYKLDFEAHDSLTFTPLMTDTMRNLHYYDTVDASPHPAWIVCQTANLATCANATDGAAVNPPGLTWAALTSWLQHERIPYRATTVEGFTVIVPRARITPPLLQRAGVLAP
jgi:hypothetical protein